MIDEINAAKGHAQIFSVLRYYIEEMGFQHFTYELVRAVDGTETDFYYSSYPREWSKHYIENKYASHDMVCRHAAQIIRPFLWTEVLRFLPKTSTSQLIVNEASELGIRAGASIPFHGHGLAKAYLAVTNNEDDDDFKKLFLEYRHALHLLGIYAHERIVSLGIPSVIGTAVKLKPRELQILNLSAIGRTARDISDILKLSEHTINEYIKEICQKLGVLGKTHAIAIAISRGLISPFH